MNIISQSYSVLIVGLLTLGNLLEASIVKRLSVFNFIVSLCSEISQLLANWCAVVSIGHLNQYNKNKKWVISI